MNAVSK